MLEIALAEARVGRSEGGVPIGAALFDAEGKLLASGRNRRVQQNDPSVHEERPTRFGARAGSAAIAKPPW